MKIFKDIILVGLGLMGLIIYLFGGGAFGKYKYLYSKPLFTLFVAPLPLVFDTEDFFKLSQIVKEDSDGNIQKIKLNKDFFNNTIASSHVRLHYNRFMGFSRYYISDEEIIGLMCEPNDKKVQLQVKIPGKDEDFITDREVLCGRYNPKEGL